MVPNLPFEIIQENFRNYRANQLLMYRAEAYPLWAFDVPKLYIIRRLLWNPDADVPRLLREFCDRTFGAAGGELQRHYVAAGSRRKDDTRRGEVTPVWGKEWPFQDTLQFHRCPPDYHLRLDAALAQGCRLPTQRRRTQTPGHGRGLHRVQRRVHRHLAVQGSGVQRRRQPGAGRGVRRRLAARKDAVMARPARTSGVVSRFQLSSSTVSPSVNGRWSRLNNSCRPRSPPRSSAAVRSGGESPAPARRTPSLLVPLGRQEHPWYKPEQTVAMNSTRGVVDGFGFQTVTNVVIHSDDDPRRNGRLKAQWLHAIGRNLPTDGRPLVLEVALQGTAGMLEIRAEGSRRNEERQKRVLAECLIPFPAEPSAATRRCVLAPASFGGAATAREDVSSKGTLTNLQLYLLWRPDQPSARLEGSATLKAVK